MYDPSIGRFITEDPIGFDGNDVNLYRYCGNGPTNAVDASGLVAQPQVLIEEDPAPPRTEGEIEASALAVFLQNGGARQIGIATNEYNCIGYSVGAYTNIEPPTSTQVDSFYAHYGFSPLANTGLGLQPGYQKVVVYGIVSYGYLIITHADLQQPDGTWVSKLGKGPLVRHGCPFDLRVFEQWYGRPVKVYIRKLPSPPPPQPLEPSPITIQRQPAPLPRPRPLPDDLRYQLYLPSGTAFPRRREPPTALPR
jgi:hypothetical protein